MFQSTPGQLAGRFHLAYRQPRVDTVKFQSTPGQLAGRFKSLPAQANQGIGVSIHARPIGRAILGDTVSCCGVFMFQSTPGQLAGRFIPLRAWPSTGQWFQSTPGQLAGRFLVRCAIGSSFEGFNPRPANWPGDFHDAYRKSLVQFVSIHARPIGRAICESLAHYADYIQFQSTPGQLAGRFRGATAHRD